VSPLLPALPQPAGPEINRQFVIERNGGHSLRDGGLRAPAPDVLAVTAVSYYGGAQFEVDEPDLPEGIDYAVWAKAVEPASRVGFADGLDFVDLFDD